MAIIDLTTTAQLSQLAAVERSAAQAFVALPALAWVAQAALMPAQRHRHGIACGTHWTARLEDGTCLGFLCAAPLGDSLHLWELSVALPYQRRGIGGALIAAATAWAQQQGCHALTLTTFSQPAWNAPWYAHQGFERLDDATLSEPLRAIRHAEGLSSAPGTERCAMRKPLAPTTPRTTSCADA